MMERLTYKFKNENEMICRFEDCETTEGKCPLINKADCHCLQIILDKLAEYEDLEEQGLLLKLLHKEVFESSGDNLYYIFEDEIIECVNCGVKMDFEGKLWITLACDEHIFPYRNPDAEHDLDPTDWCTNFTDISVEEWGKTVFLTQSEAEQKLKEMESD